ncbi:MAG: twin-arginine translocation signal domain-containing protein [Balneolaceae bacterium]
MTTRRDFLHQTALTGAGLAIAPTLPLSLLGTTFSGRTAQRPKVAYITTTYSTGSSHSDVIGTKLFLGIPTDEGILEPEIEVVSMWIDQIEEGHTGPRVAELNNVPIYDTIEEAMTLGQDRIAVDAVIYVGEHGDYAYNRLGQKMYPRMNHLEQIFRVIDANDQPVPVFNDKHLSYNWLDCRWIYDRAKELQVPMMAGSSLAYCWRDPVLHHPIGTEITEAVAIGYASLDAYGHHVLEMLQCMVERRKGGESGVASVRGIEGDAVWQAIDEGLISEELVLAACNVVDERSEGNIRELVSNPSGILIEYNDGLRAAILMLDEVVNAGWAYAARADGEIQATEFVLSGGPIFAHFSYLTLNIQAFITRGGVPPVPIERNVLTTGILDMGLRSVHRGMELIETPFLNYPYEPTNGLAIFPSNPRPVGASIGAWPPPGKKEAYDFIIQERYR